MMRNIMYDSSGLPQLYVIAPMLHDICAGMVYLHSRNIVHGGRRKGVRGGGGMVYLHTRNIVHGGR